MKSKRPEKRPIQRPVASPRRRSARLRWGAALGLILAAGGALLDLSLRHPAAETGPDMQPLPPAERALRETARRRPSDPEAQVKLGGYLLEQGRPYEAIWAFQDALDLRPGDGEACRGLARALIVAHLPTLALQFLSTCSTPPAGAPIQNPNAQRAPEIQNPIEFRRVAAAAYLAMGDPVGAVAVLSTDRAALDASAPALMDMGNAEEALGDDGAALTGYQRLLQLQPENSAAALAMGRVAARQRRWAVAFPALERARRAAPEDPRPVYQLGVALLLRGGPEAESEGPRSAVALFRRVLRLDPGYGPAYRQLGLWYARRNQPRAAALMLEKAVSLHAGGEETRRQLAAALEAAGEKAAAAYQRGLYQEALQRPDRALEQYERLAALDPNRRDVPLLLSTVYSHLERPEQALEVARQGLARHPDDPALLARCAMLLMMADHRPAAAEFCRRWLQRQPQAAEPYRLLGRLEREALHPAAAIPLAEQATARDPRSPEYALEAGLALAGAPAPANLRRAAAALRRAIALDPQAPEPHLRLGELLERLGDHEGAREQFQRGMDLDPTTRRGVYGLSQGCARDGKPARARFYAQIVPILSQRGDALQALERQLLRTPDDADARARLARLLLERGDLAPARAQLVQVVALRPGRKKEQRALEMLQRILDLQEQ